MSVSAIAVPSGQLPVISNALKPLVRGIYDLQKLRIQMGNRVVANFKAKLGQDPGSSEEELDLEAQKLLKQIRTHFARMTDAVVTLPKRSEFKGDEVISTYAELVLISGYLDIEVKERQLFGLLAKALEDYSIYTEYLKDIKGIGPAMAGILISEIDITAAKYVSSLWKYAGLDVAADGKGRSKRKEHLHEVEYTDRDGKVQTKMGITFNPFLKTKLVGVLATSFLRASNPKYSQIYNNYKHRMEQHIVYKEVTKKHRHNMAMRYMIKMFLKDLYMQWRRIEGLEVFNPYEEAKLGMKPHKV